MSTKFISFLLFCFSITACSTAPSQPLLPAHDTATSSSIFNASQINSPSYFSVPAGLADDYAEADRTPERLEKDFKILKKLNVRYYRIGMAWGDIEKKPGVYDWAFWDQLFAVAQQNGITVIPYICYTPAWLSDRPKDFWRSPPKDPQRFGQFMKTISSRYRGLVQSWELWNEPDLENYWLGNVDEFAQLIQAGSKGVREGNPSAKIILAGMAQGRGPFFEKLMEQYPIHQWVDAFNVHGYLETWDGVPTEAYPQRLKNMRSLIQEKAPGKPLWLAEFGYSSKRQSLTKASEWADAYYQYEHTPLYQAVALWKSHVLVTGSQQVSLMTWYRLHDLPKKNEVIGDDNNRHLGLLNLGGEPKPAWYAFHLYQRLFNSPVRVLSKNEAKEIAPIAQSQAIFRAFQKMNGDLIVTGWLRTSHKNELKELSGVAVDHRREVVQMQLPLSQGTLTLYDINGKIISKETGANFKNGILTTSPLRGDQVFIGVIHSSREQSSSSVN